MSAIIRDLVAREQYSEAYSYAASQIQGDAAWHQGLVDWLEVAADVNSGEPTFWRDFAFTSNALAKGWHPDSAEAQLLNQLVSDDLARGMLERFAVAFENNTTISPADIFNDEIKAAVTKMSQVSRMRRVG